MSKKKKRNNLFSGDRSREMWAEVACINDAATHNALYSMGVMLQRLENELARMQESK